MTIKQIKSYVFILFVLTLPYASNGSNIKTAQGRLDHIQDSLERVLSTTTNPDERYALLLNISDIAQNKESNFSALRHLYSEAFRNNNEPMQIEALRNLANYTNLDSLLLYYSFSQHLQPNTHTDGLRTLLLNRINDERYKKATYAERSIRIQELINEYKEYGEDSTQGDIYKRIHTLTCICNLMRVSIKTDIYSTYLEELERLTHKLPPENFYLRGSVDLYLAMLYTFQEEHSKAIVADKRLIEYIHGLEEMYRKQGRIYRQYHSYYYSIYRRMLSNYPALSMDEVELYYSKLREVAHKNEHLFNNFYKEDGRPHLYYYLAHKNYAQAAHYAEIIFPPDIPSHILLRYKIDIARALGKKDELLAHLDSYIVALEEFNKARTAEKIQEFQILYDVEATRSQNIELKLKAKELEVEAARRNIYMGLAIIALLLVLLVVVMLSFIRHKQMNRKLTIARDQAQSADRLKTMFIQNINHEIRTPLNAIVGFSQLIATNIPCNDEKTHEYSRIVETNNDILLGIFDNIMQLSDLEAGSCDIKLAPCFPNSTCEMALDSARRHAKAGVALTLTSTVGSDFSFISSPKHIQEILSHLLDNAIKSTNGGSIDISAAIDEAKQQVIFAVTDTGIGIPPDKSEVIFNRFEKLDSFSHGNGLGLYICRLLAQQLGGSIYLDTAYTAGARFVLTLNLNSSRQ